MTDTLQYIIDEKGHKTSVLVPVKLWVELNTNYEKLQKKLEILNGIRNGLNEVEQHTKARKNLPTLKDFLSGSNS